MMCSGGGLERGETRGWVPGSIEICSAADMTIEGLLDGKRAVIAASEGPAVSDATSIADAEESPGGS